MAFAAARCYEVKPNLGSVLDELPDVDCVDYDATIRESGHCIASEAPQSVQTATTVRTKQ